MYVTVCQGEALVCQISSGHSTGVGFPEQHGQTVKVCGGKSHD